MHVDGARAAAFGALAATHQRGVLRNAFGRKLFGKHQQVPGLVAFFVAKPQIAVAHTAKQNGGATVVALGHRSISDYSLEESLP
jgi:hypothetical protein